MFMCAMYVTNASNALDACHVMPCLVMLWRYIRTFVCAYVRICVCTYMCVYVCMHACMHVCMYVCMYACMHVCNCVRMIVCKVRRYVYTMFIHEHACMTPCMSVRLCMYVCILAVSCCYIHAYQPTYIHKWAKRACIHACIPADKCIMGQVMCSKLWQVDPRWPAFHLPVCQSSMKWSEKGITTTTCTLLTGDTLRTLQRSSECHLSAGIY